MKKLVAILALCLTCALCVVGFVACGDAAVKNVAINENGDLVLTMTNGNVINAGKVVDNENPQGFDFYLLPDGTYAVSAGMTRYLEDVTVPSTYKGKAVTKIISVDQQGCWSYTLKSITIPNSVTSIGEFAFYGCSRLTELKVPSSITFIGNRAFCDCVCEIQWEQNSSITNISFESFYGYNGTSISIPNGVTSIEQGAFRECSRLISVTIPDSVTRIEQQVFDGCISLTDINVSDGNKTYKSIDGNLYSKDGTALIKYAMGKPATEFIIPESVTNIGNAFKDCIRLTTIMIGGGVTSIGLHAFVGCSNLTSIIVDDYNADYKSIDGNLYSKDGTILIEYAIGKSATEFVIPDGVVEVHLAFDGCIRLTSVTIPSSVIWIVGWAFESCSNLTIINYKGTKAQWDNMYYKNVAWADKSAIKQIICTDGTILL